MSCEKLAWALLLVTVATNVAAQESGGSYPASLVVTPLTNMEVVGARGGPFSPDSFQYRLSASNGTVKYSIVTPSWLTISSRFGTTDTGGVVITLTVNTTAAELPPGTYRPHVAFRNVSNGRGSTNRIATLVVQQPPSFSRPPSASPSSRPPSASSSSLRSPSAPRPSASHRPSADGNDRGLLLDGSAGYLLDDRGDRLRAQ